MKSVLKSITLALFYFLMQILISALLIFYSITNGMEKGFVDELINKNLLIITLLSNFLFILVIGLYYKSKNFSFKNNKREEKVENISSYIILLISVFLFSIVISLTIYFESSVEIISSVDYFNKIYPNLGFILMALNLLIFSPLGEEILCRGLMINELRKKYSLKISVVISSVIFGFMHLFAGGFILALMATIIGMVFGFIFIKTKSLIVTIIAHSVANFPDFINMVLPDFNYNTKLTLGVVLLFISIFLFIIWIKLEDKHFKINYKL